MPEGAGPAFISHFGREGVLGGERHDDDRSDNGAWEDGAARFEVAPIPAVDPV